MPVMINNTKMVACMIYILYATSYQFSQLYNQDHHVSLLGSCFCPLQWLKSFVTVNYHGCFIFCLYLAGKVTDQEAVMLLRCYGALMVKVHPSKRAEMLDEAWKQLQEMGIKSYF